MSTSSLSESKQRTSQKQSDSSITKSSEESMQSKFVPILVALLVVSAFAVGMLYGQVQVYKSGAGVGAGTAQGDAPEVLPEAEVEITDDLWNEMMTNPVAVKGEESAAVTMVEFTDYQCPFCAQYFNDTYGRLVENFVDTGKMRYIVRDLPLSFHQNAEAAAVAARCAGEQEAYFPMHDALYANQEEWSTGDPTEAFVGFAGEIGLNSDAFATCLDSGKYDDAIADELALAAKVGATGTPTFFINGERVVGAQPYEVFEAAIQAALQ